MKIVVETSTGSVYKIDPGMQLYEKLSKAGEDGHLVRTSVGFYETLQWDTAPDGLRLALTCEAPDEGLTKYRLVSPPIRKVESA